MTNDFPVFDLDETRLFSRFLDSMSRTAGFVEMCRRESEGTTNRVRLPEERFLSLKIPLPPLSEQRRIMRQIEELTALVREARSLREQSVQETKKLLTGLAHRLDLNEEDKIRRGWRRCPLDKCIRLVRDTHKVQIDQTYPNFGIYSFGRGLFLKPPIDSLLTSATTLHRVKTGQFVYSRLFAFEGAYGVVSDEYDGFFISNEYPTFDCIDRVIRIEFLSAYFKAPDVWQEVAAGSKGLGDRRQRVQPEQILNHVVWLPPMEWQNQVAYMAGEIESLTEHQVETAAELDALLPAILESRLPRVRSAEANISRLSNSNLVEI